MFHTYILTSSGRKVDIDRASFLMNRDLFQKSVNDMEREKRENPRWDANYGPQWVWDHYCFLHERKYGKLFEPDTSPTWDS